MIGRHRAPQLALRTAAAAAAWRVVALPLADDALAVRDARRQGDRQPVAHPARSAAAAALADFGRVHHSPRPTAVPTGLLHLACPVARGQAAHGGSRAAGRGRIAVGWRRLEAGGWRLEAVGRTRSRPKKPRCVVSNAPLPPQRAQLLRASSTGPLTPAPSHPPSASAHMACRSYCTDHSLPEYASASVALSSKLSSRTRPPPPPPRRRREPPKSSSARGRASTSAQALCHIG
eukprot:SAG11_NODE_2588_length_3192_cov_8.847721_2_plen_233_part_00